MPVPVRSSVLWGVGRPIVSSVHLTRKLHSLRFHLGSGHGGKTGGRQAISYRHFILLALTPVTSVLVASGSVLHASRLNLPGMAEPGIAEALTAFSARGRLFGSSNRSAPVLVDQQGVGLWHLLQSGQSFWPLLPAAVTGRPAPWEAGAKSYRAKSSKRSGERNESGSTLRLSERHHRAA